MDKAPSVPPQYSVQMLQDYIKLTILMTGQEVKELPVSDAFFTFYKEQLKSLLKNFNALPQTPMKDDDMVFMGIKLIPILKKEK